MALKTAQFVLLPFFSPTCAYLLKTLKKSPFVLNPSRLWEISEGKQTHKQRLGSENIQRRMQCTAARREEYQCVDCRPVVRRSLIPIMLRSRAPCWLRRRHDSWISAYQKWSATWARARTLRQHFVRCPPASLLFLLLLFSAIIFSIMVLFCKADCSLSPWVTAPIRSCHLWLLLASLDPQQETTAWLA